LLTNRGPFDLQRLSYWNCPQNTPEIAQNFKKAPKYKLFYGHPLMRQWMTCHIPASPFKRDIL